MIDTHLGNAIAHGLHIAKIAASDPIKSGVNPRYSLPIFQARQPALESFALDNFKHAQNVTHEQHSVKAKVGAGETAPSTEKPHPAGDGMGSKDLPPVSWGIREWAD